MEASDLPLVVPMTATINAMFGTCFEELEQMKQQILVEGRPPKREEAPTPAPSPEELAAAQLLATSGAGKKPPAKQSKKDKEKLAQAQAEYQAAAAAAAAAALEENNRQVEEIDLANRPKDPWRALAADTQNSEDALLESHQKPHAWMRDRLAHLCSKTDNTYMIEDILGEWMEPLDHVPEGCIDAIAMANHHSENLTKKYGYVPPRGLHEVGKVEAWDQTQDANQPKFKEHASGARGMDTEFICAASLNKVPTPPPLAGDSSGSGITRRHAGSSTSEKKMGGGSAEKKKKKRSSGGFISDDDSGDDRLSSTQHSNMQHGKGASGVADVQAVGWGVRQGFKKALVPPTAVEVSATHFLFTNCFPGTTYTKRLIVWNRDNAGRRFKIAPMPTTMLTVKAISPKSFHCDLPIVPGSPVEFEISYTPVQAKCYNDFIQLGHCRNLNATQADKSEASQWTFIDIDIEATAMEPKLQLDAPFDLDPCFAFSRTTVTRKVTNIGCAGVFTLKTKLPFIVDTSEEFVLDFNESREVEVTFAPDTANSYEEEVTVTAKLLLDISHAEDIFTDAFPLHNEALLPDVFIESLGGANLDRLSGGALTNGGGDVPFAFLEDTCEGLTSQKHVAVKNNSPLPMPFEWHHESSGSCDAHIMPPTGVLAPERTTVFVVEITPDKAECIEALFKLMLAGLPEVPKGFVCPEELARKRRQPVLGSYTAMKDVDFGDAKAGSTDPFHLFSQAEKATEVDTSKAAAGSGEVVGETVDVDAGGELVAAPTHGLVYSCAIRLAADPTETRAHLIPEEIINEVPSLVQQANHREFLLTNDCACDLEFVLNPPRGIHHPGSSLTPEEKQEQTLQLKKLKDMLGPQFKAPSSHVFEELDLQFQPQRGVVTGNSSVAVSMSYTLKRVGPIDIDIECFMPQLADRSPTLRLQAEGQGPTVHPSASFIDFGIIPKDGEGEARLTLANHSPIPLVWRLYDPNEILVEGTEGETRFCFMPETGPLKPRAEVPVTVYLRGADLEPGAFSEQIQIVVENGVSKWIEIRACIQEPRAHITPSVLEFKNVDRDQPTSSEVFLHNDSAVDIEYSLQVLNKATEHDNDDNEDEVAVSEGGGGSGNSDKSRMEISFPQPSGILYSGIKNMAIPIRAVFHGEFPSTTAVAVISPQLRDTPVFEITCDRVNQLAVCLSLRTAGGQVKATRGNESPTRQLGTSSGGGDLASSKPKRQTPSSFVRSLLDNLLIRALNSIVIPTATVGESSARELASSRELIPKAPQTTLPYCPPLQFNQCRIPDGIPYYVTKATITVDNTSGCVTRYVVNCTKYNPFLPGEMTLGSTAIMGTATLVKAANQQLAPLGATGTVSGPLTTAGGAGGGKSKNQHSIALRPTALQSPFSCKQRDGRGDGEIEEKSRLERCTKLLLDGKGAALELKNSFGNLHGHDASNVTVTFWANLPGLYYDTLQVHCDGLPSATVPVTMEVRGKPLVLDPATSGLMVPSASDIANAAGASSGGEQGPPATETTLLPTLMLPTLVGGMSSVKRRMKITSRCPRDLEVTAVLVEAGAFIGATMEDQGGVLGLNSKDISQDATGCGVVTPSRFFLPSLQTVELCIEYSPSAQMQDPLWKAQLMVSSTVAISAFNDTFLIDEYFGDRKTEYPVTRTIQQESLLQNPNKTGEVLRGVNKVIVRTPVVDRHNVVQNSQICSIDYDEFAIGHQSQNQSPLSRTRGSISAVSQRSFGAGSSAKSSAGDLKPRNPKFDPSFDMESDDEKEEMTEEEKAVEERARAARQTKSSEERERTLLRAWLEHRRLETVELTDKYLEPIIVNVMARTVEAKLTCDPVSLIKLPFCWKGGDNCKTLHLSNNDVAPLDFRIEVDHPFTVADINFIPHKGAKCAQPSNTLLKSISAAKKTMHANSNTTSFGASVTAPPGGTASRKSIESDPLNTLFQLRPLDELDVVIKLGQFTTLEGQIQVDGKMRILFNNGTTQEMPLLATVHVPLLRSEPSRVEFIPPVIIDDGKPQPKYHRTIKLSNRSMCDAKFTIRHLPANKPLSRGTMGPGKQDRVLQTLKEKPSIDKGAAFARAAAGKSLQPLGISAASIGLGIPTKPVIIDDPTRFRISPSSGIIPAAQLSGAPTKLPLEVWFDELATAEFESQFEVVVEDGMGTVFTLNGVSRETEINV